MNAPFIPPRTRAELAWPAARGQRHEQMKKIVLPLLGAGLAPQAVFVQLRGMYDSDMDDREIREFITWASSKNPRPCGYGYTARYHSTRQLQAVKPVRVTVDEATANVDKWLGGFRCDECDLWHVSPWRPLEDWNLDSMMLLAALYGKAEYINVVTDFTIDEGGKANPRGTGRILLRDDWLRILRDRGTPQSKAGAWIRPNPVKERGSGKDGAITDADVTSYRLALIESDLLPVELQLSLWARLPLPIAAIIASGGRGPHAWVKVDCADAEEYQAKVERIYSLLTRFGICPSNKNPSRLSRMPGAQRAIGAHADGRQRLLYLNDEPTEAPIFEGRT
jgi:hypothetical protein